MIKSYFKVALRSLNRSRLFSMINILGLAIGLASFLLLAFYVQHELSYDRYHNNADRIVFIEYDRQQGDRTETIAEAQPGFGAVATETFPEVEAFARFRPWGTTRYWYEEQPYPRVSTFADPSWFEIFDVPVLQGNAVEGLKRANTLAISESSAEMMFGDDDPIGKTVLYDNRVPFEIVAVFEDIPVNSDRQYDAVMSMECYRTEEFAWGDFDLLTAWNTFNFPTYLLLAKDTNRDQLSKGLVEMVKPRVPEQYKDSFKIRLRPLLTMHLGESIARIRLIGIIGLFTLVIALMNYMNLATARAALRSREIGMRKVLGGTVRELRIQFLGEAVLLTLIAGFLAMVFVELAMPWFRNLVERDFVAPYFMHPWLLLPMLLFLVLVGVMAGSYPATVLARTKPISMLRKSSSPRSQSHLRRILVVVQFSLTIAMLFGTVTVFRQLQYMRSRDIGFDTENLIYVGLSGEQIRMQAETIKEQMAKDPRILHSSVVSRMIGRQDGGGFSLQTAEMKDRDETMSVSSFFADDEIDETLGFKIVWGRTLDERDRVDAFELGKLHYLLNETAVKAAGMDPAKDPRMTIYGGGDLGELVGVVKDINYLSLHYKPEPMSIAYLRPESMFDRRYIAFRVSPGPIDEVIASLKRTYAEFDPQGDLSYYFLDDEIEKQYRAEQRLGVILRSFSGLAFFIALLGLVGMAAHTAQRRRKEIGIRRVLGASIPVVIRSLLLDMTWPVLLSAGIALPFSWFYMQRWLTDFPYRINLQLGGFALIGLGVMFVAWLVVAMMTWQAATMNPVETLRDE